LIKQLFQSNSFLLFIGIAVIAILIWLGGDQSLGLLRYDASAINDGQYWRAITGHIVHSNGWHLLLNLASLIMIGTLFSERLTAKMWLLVFSLSALAVSACYFWLAPEFGYYVGLSAVLYGVIIIGALLDIKQQPFTGWVVLVFVTARVIWQQYSGSVDSLAEIIEDRVAIESHLFGISTGYVLGLLLLWRQRKMPNNKTETQLDVIESSRLE